MDVGLKFMPKMVDIATFFQIGTLFEMLSSMALKNIFGFLSFSMSNNAFSNGV